MSSRLQRYKIAVVGDAVVGKTVMAMKMDGKDFAGQYTPTIHESSNLVVKLDDAEHQVELVDTAGQEDFDRIRRIAYTGTHVFILCFSLVEQTSFNNITATWIEEIRGHAPNAPILLVGMKKDLCKTERGRKVTMQEGQNKAKEIKAVGYLECSGLTGEGVTEVLHTALRQVVPAANKKTSEKKSKCDVL